MSSIWQDYSVSLPQFQHLTNDLQVDVLIIGGGLTGILCAYMLERANVKYALLEAQTIANGITKNTTAKITAQHGLIYDKLMHKFGAQTAALYLKANLQAVNKYSSLCADIDCDFERKDAFVYSVNSPEKIEKELNALHALKYNAELVKEIPLPFQVAGAVRFANQAQFNPLKFIAAIAKGLNIYEHTKVCELSKQRAVTNGGTVTAKKIIMAAHFPFVNKHGSYFLKLYQHRSYVIALENAPEICGMYVDEAEKGMSFRNYKGFLLVGGAAHRTGKKGGSWQELKEFSSRYYPLAKEKYRWAAQDCMSLDGMPYIGNYSKNTQSLLVATGFNKWGITSAMVAAEILTDNITQKYNPYAAVFSPSRSILTAQLAVNGFEAIANMAAFSKHRCPHMGCALRWNSAERTWDCPCHGSRFEQRGKLIDNPSTENLNIKH